MGDNAPPSGATGNGNDEAGKAAPGLEESIREVGSAGRQTLDAATHTLRSLRRLASADFALARSAFGRALAWAGVAIVFGASAWLLVTGALIALMQRFGFSWLQSLSFAALLSLAVAALAAWKVGRYFDYTGMHATRRQLSKLGLFDEDGADEEEPPAPPAPGNAGP